MLPANAIIAPHRGAEPEAMARRQHQQNHPSSTSCQRFHLYVHAYALLLLLRGLSLVQISLIGSMVIGTIFAMEVPTGILADRIGRKYAHRRVHFPADVRRVPLHFRPTITAGTSSSPCSPAPDSPSLPARMEALVYDSLPETDRENAMKRAMGRVNSWGADRLCHRGPSSAASSLATPAKPASSPAIALTVAALLVGLLFCLTLQEPAKSRGDQGPGSMALFSLRHPLAAPEFRVCAG